MTSIDIFTGAKVLLGEKYLKYCLTLDTRAPHILHFHNFLKTFWGRGADCNSTNAICELHKAICFGDTPNGDISYMIGWLEKDNEEKKIKYLEDAINKGNGDAAYIMAEFYYYNKRDYDKVADYIGLIKDKNVRAPVIHIFWDDWYADKAPYMFRTVIQFN